ncbi:hypothetical protein AVEN_272432-1 [Araneus ventricosus]|uniref:Uncharacterized protein n=1 Tax=Araneus ventricosus TaxID=182803 RepID=A0A4Y2V0D8_ARAVE|nr:hypothetical protein AVEN_272432-1 [Araneus ventricosus]
MIIEALPVYTEAIVFRTIGDYMSGTTGDIDTKFRPTRLVYQIISNDTGATRLGSNSQQFENLKKRSRTLLRRLVSVTKNKRFVSSKLESLGFCRPTCDENEALPVYT